MGLANENKSMEEASVGLRRFGDEQSTLLDQFERLSFEAQLKQAILGRSLSESRLVKRYRCSQLLAQPPAAAQVGKGRCGSGFNRVLKKLMKPILGGKGNAEKNPVTNPNNSMFFNAFSRSLRF
ncbi:hypothetical protein PVK06_034524 [Gossypium arboreum]|uniref:Uncharacterized protein n=1 Tax=Gossypium arboreum TaxID=29729 RepID=A0ABR0NGJ9_GOSAR|nr:hypothetical protein PVK06_034524 [Gossypium arboreum]